MSDFYGSRLFFARFASIPRPLRRSGARGPSMKCKHSTDYLTGILISRGIDDLFMVICKPRLTTLLREHFTSVTNGHRFSPGSGSELMSGNGTNDYENPGCIDSPQIEHYFGDGCVRWVVYWRYAECTVKLND